MFEGDCIFRIRIAVCLAVAIRIHITSHARMQTHGGILSFQMRVPFPLRQTTSQTDRKSALSVCEARREEEVMGDGSRSEHSEAPACGRCGVRREVHT